MDSEMCPNEGKGQDNGEEFEIHLEGKYEERRGCLGDQRRADEDALRQRCVLLEAEPAGEARMADEPHREVVAAVEVEAA